jgi:hypothetical protein
VLGVNAPDGAVGAQVLPRHAAACLEHQYAPKRELRLSISARQMELHEPDICTSRLRTIVFLSLPHAPGAASVVVGVRKRARLMRHPDAYAANGEWLLYVRAPL